MSTTGSASDNGECKWCGLHHPRTVCHLVKAIEYHANGTVKRVEFRDPQPVTGITPYLVGSPNIAS